MAFRGAYGPLRHPSPFLAVRAAEIRPGWFRRGTRFDSKRSSKPVPALRMNDEEPPRVPEPRDVPETPPGEPQPAPVRDPPAEPDPPPYVVQAEISAVSLE